MAYQQMTQDEIVAREKAIYDEGKLARLSDADIHKATMKDRRGRWRQHIDAMTIRPEIADWAAFMTQRHGPKVQCHHDRLTWVMALLVVRYGEAEYHWPAEAFSDGDVTRAIEIKYGDLGDALSFIMPDDDED